MKILQLGKFYPIRGGVEKVMWNLTRGLSARGIECDMLCAEEGRSETIHLHQTGTVFCVRAIFKASATMISPAMISWLRKHGCEYDIVHIHHPDPMACLALRLSGYKGRVILHWHSDILKQKFFLKLYQPLQNWLIKRADTIIGTTPVYLKESPYLAGVQEKTVAVPIGIDPIVPNRELSIKWKERFHRKKLVVSIGRLVPYKGYGYLIDASKQLSPDYQVLVIGDGPIRENLEAEVVQKGVSDRIKFIGYVEDEEAHALLAAADVFVLSSMMKTEAFGIVQIEAMSLGIPVIATEIPASGVSWVNASGESGLNVPARDSSALAGAITTICSNPGVHERLSSGALERFNMLFTTERMIEKTIKIYNDEAQD